jgi:hypothetical protein
MNTIRVVGIDIAKSVFQVCVWMVDGSIDLPLGLDTRLS